jgi:hypothetical protein
MNPTWFNKELKTASEKAKKMPDWMKDLRGQDIPMQMSSETVSECQPVRTQEPAQQR